MDILKKRVISALAMVIISITVGTAGFWLLDEGHQSVLDCMFMTVITLSTVGYSEVIPLTGGGKIFASVLIVLGMGSMIYFGSTVISFFVEIDHRQIRRRKKMQKKIDNLSGHTIICGIGTTGSKVVSEFIESGASFVMVDANDEQLDGVINSLKGKDASKLLYITGDATEDSVLEQAGIERASGLVAALRNDKENLYVILSARTMNPNLRIIARATEPDAPPKMMRAGADRVVAPNLLGGMRIASEMIRPHVVEFIDIMLRDREQNTRIEQVVLPPNSPLAKKRLSDSKIRKATDVLVIAIRRDNDQYIYNPGPDTILEEKDVLVVLGSITSVEKLRSAISQKKGITTTITR